MNNKDKELRRLDKIAKLELMIEEYGLEGFMKIFFEVYDNTMSGVVTKFNINIETTKKTIKDNE